MKPLLSAPPDGYALYKEYKMPGNVGVTVAIYVGALLIFGAFVAFIALYAAPGNISGVTEVITVVMQFMLATVMGAAALAFHEFIRGWIASARLKGKVKIGFSLGMIYCTCPKAVYTKLQYAGYSLFPQLIFSMVIAALSALAFYDILPFSWFMVLFFTLGVQISASLRDIIIFIGVLVLPKGAYLRDRGKALDVFLPAEKATELTKGV